MKKYLAVFRIRFLYALQYRTAAAAGVATQFAWGFMVIFQFRAFYKADFAAFPMRFDEAVSYIWIQQAFFRLFAMWSWDTDIIASISEGSVAYEMARPVSLYRLWFCRCAASRAAKALLGCIPVLAVAFLLPSPYSLSPPSDLGALLFFAASMLLSLGVIVSFSMLIYTAQFFTLSSSGIRLIAAMLSDFLSGLIIPLQFFPASARAVAEALPFASMQYMPIRIYCGGLSALEAVGALLLQAFWLVVLLLAGTAFMKKALRRVVVQGG